MRHPKLPLRLLSGRYLDHETFLLAWSVLIGVGFGLGAPPPASIAFSIPYWLFLAWASCIAGSGLVGLVGCWWPYRADVAMEIERGALMVQSGCWALYVGCVWAYAGQTALIGGVIAAAWGSANLARAWRITRALRVDRVEQADRRATLDQGRPLWEQEPPRRPK